MCMKTAAIFISLILFIGSARAQSVIAESSEIPRRNISIIYYDDSFLFLSRHYGDHRDVGGNTEPGLFVHSKAKNGWIQILKVSTKDGKFGKSWSENEEEMKKLMMISVGWDFSSLASQPYADMPLLTSGSIAFPDKIELLEDGRRYKLSFMTKTGVRAAATHLYVSRDDLEKEFDKLKRP